MNSLPDSEGLNQQLARDAAQIVHSAVGGVVVGVERIAVGVMTHKFAVSLSAGLRYVVRFYPQPRSFVVQYEPDVLRRCAQVGIPVPDVVVDSRTGPKATLAYVAYRMIPGVNLEERLEFLDAKSRKVITRRLVECMQNMKEIAFHGYGELCDGWSAASPTWKSFVHEAYHQGLAAIQSGHLLDNDKIAKLTEIGNRLECFSPNASSVLIWGDVRAQNILLDDQDRFAGLLDFEGVLAGDPLVTLGYGYAAWGDRPLFSDCVETWPDKIDWQQLYFYSVLRLLRIAKYAHMPLPTGGSRAGLTQVLPGFESALQAL